VAVDKNGDNPEEAVVFDLSGGEAAGVAQFAAAIVSRREMPIHWRYWPRSAARQGAKDCGEYREAKAHRSAAVGHSLLIDGSNYFCFVVSLNFI